MLFLAHDIRYITSINSIWKSSRNRQKRGNKLVRRWQIHESKERKIKLKSEKARWKRKGVQKKKLIGAQCESNIKTCWNACFFGNCNFILLVDDYDEIAIAIPSIHKTVSTNCWANSNYSRSSFIRDIKTESLCNTHKKVEDQIDWSKIDRSNRYIK